jgi:flagella basal body P-ring formation protein FlgA
MKGWYRRALAPLCAALAWAGVACAQTQELEAVRRTAEAFARSQIAGLPGDVEVEAAPLDPRLQLGRCDAPEAYLPLGTRLWGKATVGVRCNGPERWSVVVPVTVRVIGEALFSARPIPRGHSLTEADITRRRTDLTLLPGASLTDPAEALGKVARVSLVAGLALRADMLRGAFVVRHGQSVQLVFVGGGFTVSSEGKALGNAAQGDTVQVRAASGKVVRGVAVEAGVVEVR